MNKIRNIFMCLVIGSASVCFAEERSLDDLETKRAYFQKLADFDITNTEGFVTIYEPIEDVILEQLAEAVIIDDEILNRSIIEYAFWRCLLLSDRMAPVKPNDIPLDQLRTVEGLKSSLLEQINQPMPHHFIFDVVAVLYSNDLQVAETLLEKADKNDVFALAVLSSFHSAGIYTEQVKSLISRLMRMERIRAIAVTAGYLERFPLSNMLPLMVEWYKKTDHELDTYYQWDISNPLRPWEVVHMPDSMIQMMQDPDQNLDISFSRDFLRFTVGQALLAYPDSELMPYKDEILQMRGYIHFGSMSGGTYDSLVSRLTLDDPKTKDAILEEPL